jgi:hypothetical protein
MEITDAWDVTPCSLVDTNFSEELAVSSSGQKNKPRALVLALAVSRPASSAHMCCHGINRVYVVDQTVAYSDTPAFCPL